MATQPQCTTFKPLGNYKWNEDIPDENKWADCVHCGLCLESCPTYELTGQEQHSPRGRVYLIKSVAEGRLEVNEQFTESINACLDCKAWTTACPASVDVGGLVEEARGQIAKALPLTGWKKTVSSFFLKKTFPHPHRLQTIGKLLSFYQKSGIQTAVRKTGATRVMPKHLADLEKVMPEIKKGVRETYKDRPVIDAQGEMKREVAFLTGCIMDVMFADINEATVNVLTRNGNRVTIPQKQTCCGALHVHAGDRETGRKLAKQNIEAFEDAHTVVVNAAGCGCILAGDYPELFKNDEEWLEKAEQFSKKVVDVSKFLVDTGYEKPKAEIKTKLTYHDACHLAHGQGVRKEPRDLLLDIPGVEMVHMKNADRCCGSAGIYNLTNPEMSNPILESKMKHVPEDVEMISMGNPGCMLQMALGVEKYGRNQKVVHTIQLLDLAYKKEEEERV